MTGIFKKNFLIFLGIFVSAFSASSNIKSETFIPSNEEILEVEKSTINKNKNLHHIYSYENDNFLENLNEEAFEQLIANNSNKNKESLNKKFLVDIEANMQSQTKDLFNAEGNVILYFSNATLKSDKVIYNRLTKEFTAEGNVVFSKGEQYFEASNIFYNFKTNKGFIKNVYGVLDVANFDDDFELISKMSDKSDNISKNNAVRNLNYINSSKFGLTANFSKK